MEKVNNNTKEDSNYFYTLLPTVLDEEMPELYGKLLALRNRGNGSYNRSCGIKRHRTMNLNTNNINKHRLSVKHELSNYRLYCVINSIL